MGFEKNRHVSLAAHQLTNLSHPTIDKINSNSVQDFMKQEAIEEEKKAHEDDD